MPRLPLIYLAGDLVFRPDALRLFERMRAICAGLGLQGLAPFDGQEAVRHLPPGPDTTLAIVRADRDLMDRCDAGLFCLDPFRRGADMDPGTAVEIGYMAARNKQLEGYTVDGRAYPEKVADYMRRHWNQALRPRDRADDAGAGGASGALEDPDGILAHSDGLVQNGMTEGFIRLSGGAVHVRDELLDAFAAAAAALRKRLA
ncbi:nucleoside 2-deoxyribosyltransferase [Rhizosaccharibacter radicis]|uniref:Nucleoside 2-deoxyribosyltransferase n=1 Tax=Rhizosaccharibacter radicis TaxID=2782605 RepID=A0ABT1VSW4_9PROT|nr:nucleoside 2-deoxyribosyltransferase [Acetobacteraceae bacterium KSS12]